MTATAHEETVHGAGHEHPTEAKYMLIALVLAIITAGEVGLYYIDIGESAAIPVLMVMMAAKFFIVASYFMHLKLDSVIFRRLFYAGLALAVCVFLAAMLAMQFFGDDTTSIPQDGETVQVSE